MRYVSDAGEERTAKPSEVACPTCRAPAGESCLRLDGRGFARAYHQARRDVAGATLIPVKGSS